MKYPKTTLFVVAAFGLLVTTAAQPNATWHMLREGYGLHYTGYGRRAAAEAELARVRPPLQAALETCYMPSAEKWSRRYSRAQDFLRMTGDEDPQSMRIWQRFAECFQTRSHPREADTLASPVP